jgi:hypothetical protein
VFVLTTREYILNQARLHYEKLAREKFDHRTCIIDLSKYSRRIRAQILYNHLHFSKLPRAHLEALVAKRGYVQIVDHKNYNPRLIEYLTDSAWIGEIQPVDYLALFSRKLDNPVEIWEHAFRNQLSARAHHLLFILTTMPIESRIDDVETAFVSFHNSQCAKFGIAHSTVDFKNALKELDGTFIATRKVQDLVLVRFQNPSIRDFMQFLLLGGELLQEVLSSLVFFEQPLWFIETLDEKEPQVPTDELARYVPNILEALKRLVGASSCSIVLEGYQNWQRALPQEVNLAERIATIGAAVLRRKDSADAEWMTAHIEKLGQDLQSGNSSASSIVGAIESLKKLGYLDSDAGKHLALALKNNAMDGPSDLDDFETLANVVESLPDLFVESELESMRSAYSEYAEWYAAACDLTNPEELREAASRIGEVGSSLKVDTNAAEETLRESARNIEVEQESDWDDDDRRGGGSSDECSDRELDSMFGTLGS